MREASQARISHSQNFAKCVEENSKIGGFNMTIPGGTLLVVAICLIIHLELIDIQRLYVKNACLGLYQIFYLQVSCLQPVRLTG